MYAYVTLHISHMHILHTNNFLLDEIYLQPSIYPSIHRSIHWPVYPSIYSSIHPSTSSTAIQSFSSKHQAATNPFFMVFFLRWLNRLQNVTLVGSNCDGPVLGHSVASWFRLVLTGSTALKKWFIYNGSCQAFSMAYYSCWDTIEGNYIIPNGLVQNLHTSSVVIPGINSWPKQVRSTKKEQIGAILAPLAPIALAKMPRTGSQDSWKKAPGF